MSAPVFDIERARLVAARRLLPEHFDEFQRLAKSVVHGPPFQLAFIDCADGSYRDRVVESLSDVLRPARLRSSRLPLNAGVPDAAALEKRLQRHAAKAEVVHVVGGAQWFNATRWDELNQRRERLARDARARLVFWLNAQAIALLSLHGQDLWAWRSGVYAFESQQRTLATAAVPSAALSPRADVPDTRSMAERHRRIAELKRMLASTPPPSEDLRVPLLDELGVLLHDLGEYDEALAHWRDVELPLHRKRQDQRAQAITMGKIADVLEARGQLDEALRIRREELLPVFERLGDQRGRAVTMGKIADVLQARGQFDEALRIRREEQLPVFERLGDQRARLVCWANLAIGLNARDGPGDRMEARQLLAAALSDAQRMRLPEAEVLGELLAQLDAK